MQAEGKITFGGYEWRMLDVMENAALIITEYIIEERPAASRLLRYTRILRRAFAA